MLLLQVCGCAKTVQVTKQDTGFRWVEDRSIRFTNREELSRCLDISPDSFDKYLVLESEHTAPSDDKENSIRARLRYDVERKLVQLIKQKMEFTFKTSAASYWEIEHITMPVRYRMFSSYTEDAVQYKYIAVYRKSDMDIDNLLGYLPYEYKEPFLERMRQRMESDGSLWP
ncbi:MAG: hypothetical protein ACOCWH_00920 [Spirochaetota bacterium]